VCRDRLREAQHGPWSRNTLPNTDTVPCCTVVRNQLSLSWPPHRPPVQLGSARGPLPIFSRPQAGRPVAQGCPPPQHNHHLLGAATFHQPTCFDRSHGISWCSCQLPTSLASSSLLSLSPILRIVRRVLSGFHLEARRPTAQTSQKSPSQPKEPPPISALTRRSTRHPQGCMHMAAIRSASSTS
jgi:hypothetical protein